MTSTPMFAQTIANGYTKIVTADSTNYKTLLTAGANGSLVDLITVTSTDTSSRDLQFCITISGTDYIFCTVSVSANSGNTSSVGLVSIFDSPRLGLTLGLPLLDSNGNKLLRLGNGEVLKVKAVATVTAAREISVRASGVNL